MNIKDVQAGKVELEDAILASIKKSEQTTRCQVLDIIPTFVKTEEARIGETASIHLVIVMQKAIKLTVNTTKDLWPCEVVDVIQQVMEQGEADGKSGWEAMSKYFHADHAFCHLNAWLKGSDCEDHLAHAFTRLMMAVAIGRGYVKGGKDE